MNYRTMLDMISAKCPDFSKLSHLPPTDAGLVETVGREWQAKGPPTGGFDHRKLLLLLFSFTCNFAKLKQALSFPSVEM